MDDSTKQRILIVDDEPDIRKYLADILTEKGYATCCAADWKEAVKLIAAENPALIILDIMLPEVSGLLIAETIKKEMGWPIPILIYSALDKPDDVITGLQYGGNAYVAKTDPMDKLLGTVKQLLRGDFPQ